MFDYINCYNNFRLYSNLGYCSNIIVSTQDGFIWREQIKVWLRENSIKYDL